jgi:hypothetical protein
MNIATWPDYTGYNPIGTKGVITGFVGGKKD